MRYSANAPCHCGSGKKFKRCCRAKAEGMAGLFEKISSGKIPFTAKFMSSGGEPGSIEIGPWSVTKNGRKTVLLHETLTLSTNTAHGDKTAPSLASISIPIDGCSAGSITTIGNASVSNIQNSPPIALAGGAKKLKTTSASGLFAVARVLLQRDTQIQFFDILFGVRGQSEEADDSGEKQRPHIALYPDGNGKFIRLSGHDCEIEGEMVYRPGTRQVLPQLLRIKSNDLEETIEITFSTENPSRVILSAIRFATRENAAKRS
jgi:SEC-C motif